MNDTASTVGILASDVGTPRLSGLQRRGFLGALGLAGISAAAVACGSGGSPSRASRRVIVIGAGVAGLAAAATLQAHGDDVTILEARDRIGGRVHTARPWPGDPIDIGASWIHGALGNPITKIATAAGVPMRVTDDEDLIITRATALGDKPFDLQRWDDLIDKALTIARNLAADVSVADAINRVADDQKLSPAERVDLSCAASGAFEQEWGADLRQLSVRALDDYAGFDGDDVLFPQGYSQVVDYMARSLKILTSEPVSSIELRASDVVVTTTSREFIADAVIVTVPLGVLKAGGIKFVPALPKAHRDAIARIPVGVLSKTFLKYDKPFWDTSGSWLGYADTAAGFWPWWLNLSRPGNHVIVGFNGGSRATALEAASDVQIVEQATRALSAMTGTAAPQPVATVTTRWSTDPWARGSYSYPGLGSSRADRRALGALIDNRLIFAGEACEETYHSTVHGAYLSGERAAADLIAHQSHSDVASP